MIGTSVDEVRMGWVKFMEWHNPLFFDSRQVHFIAEFWGCQIDADKGFDRRLASM